MPEKSAEQIYDKSTSEGEYRQKEPDELAIKRMSDIAVDNVKFAETLIRKKVINWRVIFLLYYDSLRELYDIIIQKDEFKCSNHQACFAYICVKFPDLELDWDFFQKVRTMRNRTHYEGKSIKEI
jgi:hypothetical protein